MGLDVLLEVLSGLEEGGRTGRVRAHPQLHVPGQGHTHEPSVPILRSQERRCGAHLCIRLLGVVLKVRQALCKVRDFRSILRRCMTSVSSRRWPALVRGSWGAHLAEFAPVVALGAADLQVKRVESEERQRRFARWATRSRSRRRRRRCDDKRSKGTETTRGRTSSNIAAILCDQNARKGRRAAETLDARLQFIALWLGNRSTRNSAQIREIDCTPGIVLVRFCECGCYDYKRYTGPRRLRGKEKKAGSGVGTRFSAFIRRSAVRGRA